MRKWKILVVDDELAIRNMIRLALTQESKYDVRDAADCMDAKMILGDYLPDLIILDWMLPGESGISFINWLKKSGMYQNIPVIMLTAKAEEKSRVSGLEEGADDYVVKPFSVRELIARINGILRRQSKANNKGWIKFNDLRINTQSYEVFISENKLKLTPNEYRLLLFFVTHTNKVYSREQIISNVWGPGVYIDDRTVDVQMRRLRDKLRPYGYEKIFSTIRSVGYICSEA